VRGVSGCSLRPRTTEVSLSPNPRRLLACPSPQQISKKPSVSDVRTALEAADSIRIPVAALTSHRGMPSSIVSSIFWECMHDLCGNYWPNAHSASKEKQMARKPLEE